MWTKFSIFCGIADMARNKGLIPSAPGEISVQRKQIKAIIESLLPACTEPDTETGEPFRAQAIIANPPAYGEFGKTLCTNHSVRLSDIWKSNSHVVRDLSHGIVVSLDIL